MFHQNKYVEYLSAVQEVSQGTALRMRWVEKYDEDGVIKRNNRQPIAYKIKQDEVKFILDEIKKDKTITMEDLLAKIQHKYPNFAITRRHLNRVVNDNNITLKMARFRHEPVKRFGKEININSKIKEFYDEVKKYNVDNIICIDETSIKSLEKRHHCYSEKGKRCVIKTQKIYRNICDFNQRSFRLVFI